LVIFGAGFFICLILAIVLYTQVSGAQQAAEEAEVALQKAGSTAEIDNAQDLVADVEAGNTVVGKLIQKVEAQRNRINALEREKNKAATDYEAEQVKYKQQQEATQSVRQELEKQRTANTQAQNELTKQVREMQATIATAEQLNSDLSAKIEQALAAVKKGESDQLTRTRDELSTQQVSMIELQREVDRLEEELRIERQPGERVDPPGVTEPDGVIVAQTPDQDRVYLDIGRSDNVMLGMAFNVFDDNTSIKLDNEKITGKAIIEIISIEENSSVARIAEIQPRQRINSGDVIANIVFDPTRTFNFHIFGQFDIDGAGEINLRDKGRVEQYVEDSGGRIVDELSYQTDYLVLGIEPEYPEKPADDRDLLAMKEYRTQLQNYTNYQDRVAEAQRLGIPVLNQNRFLDLVGYYRR
jgi:hypothetical protein